jgi:hypothetical protein
MRKLQDVEIARIFRVPLHFLQLMDGATFSNIEQRSLEFVLYTMLPWLGRWEAAIARDLLSDIDAERYCVRFNPASILRGDSQARAEFYSKMVNIGVYTINECRAMEGMEPVEGGDTPIVQGAMISLQRAITAPAPTKPSTIGAMGEVAAPETVASHVIFALSEARVEADRSAAASKQQAIKLESEVSRLSQNMASCAAASADALADQYASMLRWERDAIRRAAKQANFLAEVDEFYADHEKRLASKLAASFKVIVALGVAGPALSDIVAEHVRTSHDQLLGVAGKCTSDALQAAIDELTESWDSRVSALRDRFTIKQDGQNHGQAA